MKKGEIVFQETVMFVLQFSQRYIGLKIKVYLFEFHETPNTKTRGSRVELIA